MVTVVMGTAFLIGSGYKILKVGYAGWVGGKAAQKIEKWSRPKRHYTTINGWRVETTAWVDESTGMVMVSLEALETDGEAIIFTSAEKGLLELKVLLQQLPGELSEEDKECICELIDDLKKEIITNPNRYGKAV